ncbi:ubiquinone anaerobic biosynthesis accessory factor UbiT [Undibacterium griseum]|uniref:Ubiquinone biosynthesis accessory factor UbiT n=1 Tax=Undibacterium griseum TaxID=2762295 RepID=A0ABR6YLL0_9BURK|nr:SCP2 sterol-binding domain-containing protein [Undibacterium griseum]MBC3884759.1 SCP2 sterol-binding domain-containing protein [Undibacterium griseum]
MDLSQFRFPAVFQSIGRHMPAPLTTTPLMLMLELARRRELLVAPDTLYGKKFSIHVEDLGMSLYFECNQGRFRSLSRQVSVDVSLSANAVDFFKMASGMEDADTLFFRRRLRMEGDTELGVAVKYWIDASERPAWLNSFAQKLSQQFESQSASAHGAARHGAGRH